MDVKVYYQKLRQIEAGITEPDAIIVSLETPDGGKAGLMTEVPREIAARMVIENRARLATQQEVAKFRSEAAEAKKAADQAAAAARMQITVLSEGDLRVLKGQVRGPKG